MREAVPESTAVAAAPAAKARASASKPPLERLVEMGYARDKAAKTLAFVSGDVVVAQAVLERMEKAGKDRRKALDHLRKRKADIKIGNIY